MDNDSLPGRFPSLASNFLTLQGLHQVALGVLLLLVSAALEFNGPWDIAIFGALLVLLGIASWRIRVYYERNFGYVERRTRPGFWGSGQPILRRGLFWLAAVLVSLAVARIAGLSLLGCLFGMLFVGWFATENRPWYYLLVSLPFFIIGALRAQILLLPVALILTGVLDHLRLIRAFPGVRPHGAA
jgi:hypothetical protein